jgi:hypothetical protein
MSGIDQIFALFAARRIVRTPTFACLYTGQELPTSCGPMLRSPEPITGQIFDTSFPDHLAAALLHNPAVHDGVVMIGRNSVDDLYRIRGWSYRLFPPHIRVPQEANRGSAYNSCIAMSVVERVDCLYLVSEGGLFRFDKGAASNL